jgi:hypothetical protein
MKRIIMLAESFFKKSKDDTEINIVSDTSWAPSYNLEGSLVMRVPDNQTPELRQLYVVTLEPVNLNPGEHPSDGYQRILAEHAVKDEIEFGKLKRVFR